MKVLIVDDSESVRQLLRQQLVDLDCDVTEAEDGYEALQLLFREQTPDVAFVDRQMPSMDGIQLIKAVRSDARFDTMRIVMCSAPLSPEQTNSLPPSAIDCFIPKPFARNAVANAILGFAIPN